MFGFRLSCSFCGRRAVDVEKLVAGRRAYICDRCAHEAIRIMEASDDRPGDRAAPAGRVSRWLRRLRRTWISERTITAELAEFTEKPSGKSAAFSAVSAADVVTGGRHSSKTVH